MEISSLDFLFQLALILFLSKMLGLLMRRIGISQVLGFIIAGILVGPAIWENVFSYGANAIFPVQNSKYLNIFAEIGVIFVMFTAGLETNLKDIKEMGLAAFVIALCGVLLPLGGGTLVGYLFFPDGNFLNWMFLGVIMTATSVGITVEVLRELGKLKTKVGTVIVSAAIIDDVLGIIVLSIALSFKGGSGIDSPVLQAINPNGSIIISILWILAFFVFAIGFGFFAAKGFKKLEEKHAHTRRISILSIALCLAYAFIAEKVFGVADITGAYIAGLVLSQNHASAKYVDKRVTVSSYMIFAPIFFASIGVKISFSGLNLDVLWLAIVFVLTAILTKIIGCGVSSRLFGFKFKDSLRIGIGMIARGEVALIVAEKGIEGGFLDIRYRIIVVMLVMVASLLAPILLKLSYKNDKEPPLPTKTELEEGRFE